MNCTLTIQFSFLHHYVPLMQHGRHLVQNLFDIRWQIRFNHIKFHWALSPPFLIHSQDVVTTNGTVIFSDWHSCHYFFSYCTLGSGTSLPTSMIKIRFMNIFADWNNLVCISCHFHSVHSFIWLNWWGPQTMFTSFPLLSDHLLCPLEPIYLMRSMFCALDSISTKLAMELLSSLIDTLLCWKYTYKLNMYVNALGSLQCPVLSIDCVSHLILSLPFMVTGKQSKIRDRQHMESWEASAACTF